MEHYECKSNWRWHAHVFEFHNTVKDDIDFDHAKWSIEDDFFFERHARLDSYTQPDRMEEVCEYDAMFMQENAGCRVFDDSYTDSWESSETL